MTYSTPGRYLVRCMACHTVGGGDKLGPDLKGVVTSRDPAWLSRWLREPDKMIAEGDPIATALKERFRNLPMPNFSLGDVEVDALVDYLQKADKKADQKVGKTAQPKAH